jgi:hypothetical protein
MGSLCVLIYYNMEKLKKILCYITITIALISLGIATAVFINKFIYTIAIVVFLIICFLFPIIVETIKYVREKKK